MVNFIIRYIKGHKAKSSIIAVALVVLFGMAAQTMLQNNGGGVDVERVPKVSLIKVGEYQVENAQIDVIGEVESLSQVELKSQISERVKEIRVGIGQAVARGQVLVVLEGAQFAAQIDQAQANLEAERVKLLELEGGTRSEEVRLAEVKVANAQLAYEDAEKAMQNTITDAYTKSDDAVRNKIEPLFNTSDLDNPELNFTVTDAQLKIDVEWEHFLLEGTLNDWQTEDTEENLEKTRSFLGKLALAINRADASFTLPQTTLDAWKVNVSSARTSLNGAISAFSGAEEKLQGAQSSLAIAENELALKEAGSTSEQIALQEARVRSAEANVENLETQLDKIILEAPISGVVAGIPVRVGELVNNGEIVISIVNPGSLQVKAYVNSKDLRLILQGAKARIEETGEGVVTRVAPSIDPETKKVEVLIAVVAQNQQSLVIGEFANVKILIDEQLRGSDQFFLPLQAIKVGPENSFVYTVSEEGRIEQHVVILGRVIGSSVEVIDGLTADMEIVFSVRGLDPDEFVEVK